MISTTTKSNPSNSVAAVFSQHSGAENAVKELKDGGFDVKKLSIIGSDYHSEENVVGFYNTGDRMMYWGKTGAFWGGLWGLLVIGGVSALGAGLFSLGIPKDSVVKYEASIKAGKFLLIAHGTADEVQHARNILQNSGAEQINIHHPAVESARVA